MIGAAARYFGSLIALATLISGTAAGQLAVVISPPVDHPVSTSTLIRTPYAWKSGVGEWGESFVDQTLRLRGFDEVFAVKSPGGQGIDRVAVKRGARAEITDIRFIEVKTTRGAASLSMTRRGRQLSRDWLAAKIRDMRNSGDGELRDLARDIARFRKASGRSIESLGELYHVDTRSGRSVRLNPTTGGELSHKSLEGPAQKHRTSSQLRRSPRLECSGTG